MGTEVTENCRRIDTSRGFGKPEVDIYIVKRYGKHTVDKIFKLAEQQVCNSHENRRHIVLSILYPEEQPDFNVNVLFVALLLEDGRTCVQNPTRGEPHMTCNGWADEQWVGRVVLTFGVWGKASFRRRRSECCSFWNGAAVPPPPRPVSHFPPPRSIGLPVYGTPSNDRHLLVDIRPTPFSPPPWGFSARRW